MTKSELIEKMAADAGISKVAAGEALDSFMENVTKALKKKDGKVTLVGFGTFYKTRRKARKGRNPQTGELIKIKAANVVKFRPGKNPSRKEPARGGIKRPHPLNIASRPCSSRRVTPSFSAFSFFEPGASPTTA
jgi:DNA-binding protein HU-beta